MTQPIPEEEREKKIPQQVIPPAQIQEENRRTPINPTVGPRGNDYIQSALQNRAQQIKGKDLRPYAVSEYRPTIYTPTSPPRNQEQTVQAMPNSEKLTPAERWIYERLPGFNESTVGKALQSFGSSPLGKALEFIDIGAEGVERTIGLGVQYLEAFGNEEKMQEFQDSLGEGWFGSRAWYHSPAWQAGSLAADTANLPQFKRDETGKITGMYMPTDLPGVNGVVKARRRIAELTDQGVDPREATVQARDELYNDLGALQLRSQINDLWVHVLADPLNVVLPYIKPIERLQLLRKSILATKVSEGGFDFLTDAQRVASEAAEIATKAGDNVLAVRKLEEAAEIGKAIENAQGITRLDNVVLSLTGGDPFKPIGKFDRFNPLALTPSSRAHELMVTVADNVGSHILADFDDPAKITELIVKAAQSGVGQEFGHAFLTVEGRTVQAVLKGFQAKAEELFAAHLAVQDDFGNVARMAELLGDTPDNIINLALKDESLPGLTTRLSNAGLEIAEDQLGKLAKRLNNSPYSPELFKYELSIALVDHAARQAIVQFGVKARGLPEKLSLALKSAETLAFLRANPAYAVRNIVNNEITMIARGVGGIFKPGEMDALWNKIGYDPIRLSQGFGAAGVDQEVNIAKGLKTFRGAKGTEIIDAALTGERGFLDKFRTSISDLSIGKFDMGQFSGKMEASASKRAFTSGYVQAWKKYWRPGKAFDHARDFLPTAIISEAEQFYPGIINALEKSATDAYGAKDLDRLVRGNMNITPSSIFDDASRRLGFDIKEQLPQEFIVKIEDGLYEAAEKGTVREFLGSIRSELQDHLDETLETVTQDITNRMENRVITEGPGSLPRIWGDVVDETWGSHSAHITQMEALNAQLRNLDSPELISAVWRNHREATARYWSRQNKRLRAAVIGIKKGARKAGIEIPDEVVENLRKLSRGTGEFYNTRKTFLDDFFDAKVAGETPPKTFDEIQEILDISFESLIENEDVYTRAIDTAISDSLPSPRQRDAYLAWRNRARELRLEDKRFVIDFRKELEGLTPRQREASYAQFTKQRQENWTEMWRNERQGLAMLAGDPVAARYFGGLSETDVANRLRDMAHRYGIPTITEEGVPLDSEILRLVNDSLPDDAEKFLNFENIPINVAEDVFRETVRGKIPDDVIRLWEVHSLHRGTVRELKTLFDELTPTQRAERGVGGRLQDAEKASKGSAMELSARLKEEGLTYRQVRNALGEAPEAIGEKDFIPDLGKLQADEAPLNIAEDQFWLSRGYQSLEEIERSALRQADKPPLKWDRLPRTVQDEIEKYLDHVKGKMGSTRYASTRFAEFKRDAALLNYNRRFNYNTWLGVMSPYEFWTTQSLFKWALHSIDRPAMLTTFLRMKKMLEASGAPEQSLPKRLRGSIRIPMPFTAQFPWLGKDAYIDPLSLALPLDTFAFPYEQYLQNQSSLEGSAARLIQQKMEEGTVNVNDAQAQIEAQSGPLWDQAVAEAQANNADLRFDAFDFVNLVTPLHAPIIWGKEIIEGTPENIGPFSPVTRMSKGVSALLGISDFPLLPHNIEGKFRQSIGLPKYDKWDNYRTERMISNMMATGDITVRDGLVAMQEQQGPLWDEAERRAGIEYGFSAGVSSLIGLPLKSYPEGEFLQRELQDDFVNAYQAYNAGDVKALNRFFDLHPEYEGRLALFKEPEERARQFLVDELWDRYNSLPSFNKREVRDQLGREFQVLFLDNETRSIDSIQLDDLQIWLKLMGGDPPGSLNSTVAPLDLTDVDVANRIDMFYQTRNRMFPNWFDIQNNYFDLVEGKPRKDYLRNHSSLVTYWNWRRDFFKRNPDVVPYLDDSFEPNYRSEAELLQAQQSQPTFSWTEWQQVLSPPLQNLLLDSSLLGRELPRSAVNQLEDIADSYGVTVDDLIVEIDDSINWSYQGDMTPEEPASFQNAPQPQPQVQPEVPQSMNSLMELAETHAVNLNNPPEGYSALSDASLTDTTRAFLSQFDLVSQASNGNKTPKSMADVYEYRQEVGSAIADFVRVPSDNRFRTEVLISENETVRTIREEQELSDYESADGYWNNVYAKLFAEYTKPDVDLPASLKPFFDPYVKPVPPVLLEKGLSSPVRVEEEKARTSDYDYRKDLSLSDFTKEFLSQQGINFIEDRESISSRTGYYWGPDVGGLPTRDRLEVIAGQVIRKTGRVATRDRKNRWVARHELAHAIDDYYKESRKQEFRKAVMESDHWLVRWVKDERMKDWEAYYGDDLNERQWGEVYSELFASFARGNKDIPEEILPYFNRYLDVGNR